MTEALGLGLGLELGLGFEVKGVSHIFVDEVCVGGVRVRVRVKVRIRV